MDEYNKMSKSTLYVHLNLLSMILTDIKSTAKEEEEAIKDIKTIKRILIKRKENV